MMETSKSGMAPLQEFLLQGSIQDAHIEALLHRLNGLCDMVDTGGPERFHDHEINYQLRGQNVQTVMLRVRRSIEHPELPCHVRYLGLPEIGDKSKHTLVRSCIDVGTTDNVRQFLQELGFRMDHEFVAKGYMFRKGRMKVMVSKLYRLLMPGNTDPHNLEPISLSHLVELSVLASHGQEQIQEVMKNFAEHIKPLVVLDKVDHRRLQTM